MRVAGSLQDLRRASWCRSRSSHDIQTLNQRSCDFLADRSKKSQPVRLDHSVDDGIGGPAHHRQSLQQWKCDASVGSVGASNLKGGMAIACCLLPATPPSCMGITPIS